MQVDGERVDRRVEDLDEHARPVHAAHEKVAVLLTAQLGELAVHAVLAPGERANLVEVHLGSGEQPVVGHRVTSFGRGRSSGDAAAVRAARAPRFWRMPRHPCVRISGVDRSSRPPVDAEAVVPRRAYCTVHQAMSTRQSSPPASR